MCDYCKSVGACPKCWGRDAIDELNVQKSELLDALRKSAEMLNHWPAVEISDVNNAFAQALAAISKAEGR